MEHPILSLASGRSGHFRAPCPFCSSTRSPANRRDKCLAVDVEADRVVWYCHHCSDKGAVPFETNSRPRPAPTPAPRKDMAPIIRPMNQAVREFLISRSISTDTAEAFQVGASSRWFGKIQANAEAIALPFIDADGRIEYVKFRSLEGKDFSSEGKPRTLFGSQLWQMGRDIIITEGELDTLAVAEAVGLETYNIGSVAAGAMAKPSDSLDNPRLAFLQPLADFFEKASRVLIAVDMDGPGNILAEEIVRRIGRAKCWRVNWRRKDANEVLALGVEAVREDLSAASAWPMAGLYDAIHYQDQIDKYLAEGFKPGLSTGYSFLDDYYTVEGGQLTVVTGLPGSGKSEFVDMLMVNLAEASGWKFAICSWENPPAVHIMKLAAKRGRMNVFKGREVNSAKLARCTRWVNDHFLFLEDHSEEPATLDSILDRLRAAILRYGIKGAVIDPYNYIVRDKGIEERVWIEDMLARVRRFAQTNGLHIWFVAHPTKIQPNGDGTTRVPKGNDISGSAAWFAKTDNGITVHRDQSEPHIAQVHIWKVRYQWIGKIGMSLLAYDLDTSRFIEAGYDDPLADDPFEDPLADHQALSSAPF